MVAQCRCLDWHNKETDEMSMAREPDRTCRSNFLLGPPAHTYAVTNLTEMSLNVWANVCLQKLFFTSNSYRILT